MLSSIDSMCYKLAVASTVFLALPCALAQQGGGPALPPPSLYDDAPPPPAAVTPVPVQPSPPARPIPAPQPAAAPVEAPRPAAAPVEAPRPAAAPVEAPRPAAAPVEAPRPAIVVPYGRSSPQGDRPTFASEGPTKHVRTGLLGDCLKMNFTDTDRWGRGACPKTTTEPLAVAAPTPAPRVVEPEPVQVQPLQPQPVEEPRILTPEPEPIAAPPPPPPPPVKTTTLAADTLFALNSFQLRPTAKAKLDEFAAELDQFDYQRIHITGHTDPTGTAQLNERLSRQRAEAVKRYLVTKGLPAGKIVAEGMGSSMPMVTDKDCSKLPRGQMVACFQPDRRVDIEVTGVTMAHK